MPDLTDCRAALLDMPVRDLFTHYFDDAEPTVNVLEASTPAAIFGGRATVQTGGEWTFNPQGDCMMVHDVRLTGEFYLMTADGLGPNYSYQYFQGTATNPAYQIIMHPSRGRSGQQLWPLTELTIGFGYTSSVDSIQIVGKSLPSQIVPEPDMWLVAACAIVLAFIWKVRARRLRAEL